MPSALQFPAAVPELTGDLVSLRELQEDDIPAWFARASDVESASLAGDPIPESIEAGTEWLATHRERFARQASIRWAIVPAGAAESAGTIGLSILSAEERTAELGLVIGRAHWSKGLGTAASRLVVRYGFETLGLAEIRAEVLERNGASRRMVDRVGFQLVGPIEMPSDDAPPEPGFLYRLRPGDVR